MPNPISITALAGFAARADIREAMKSANSKPRNCDADNVKWLDEYQSPTKNGVIAEMLSRPLSIKLSDEAKASHGQLVQLMVMDKTGCLIAADAKTHDLQQADEQKYKETLKKNLKQPLFEGATLLEKGSVDQLSQALYSDDGQPIGVITMRWCPVSGGCS